MEAFVSLFTASRREQDNYSGPGSIQMENTYIPELLDGWDLVLQRGLVLLGSALEPVLSFYRYRMESFLDCRHWMGFLNILSI